jgi:hypothetical protein
MSKKPTVKNETKLKIYLESLNDKKPNNTKGKGNSGKP